MVREKATDKNKLEMMVSKIVDRKLSIISQQFDDRITQIRFGPLDYVYRPTTHSGAIALPKRSWMNTLKSLKKDFNGSATPEAVGQKLNIRRSVASGYLSRLSEIGLVKKKYNHTQMKGRYLFVITELGGMALLQSKR